MLQFPQLSEHTSRRIILIIRPRALQSAVFPLQLISSPSLPPTCHRTVCASATGRRSRDGLPAGVSELRSVRQINTPTDPMAHPPLCRSSASCRSSRFPFLQVSAPWPKITSATLRWSTGTRPSGWNDRRWRQVEAMQAPTNTHTRSPWSHGACFRFRSADGPVWWSAVTAIFSPHRPPPKTPPCKVEDQIVLVENVTKKKVTV